MHTPSYFMKQAIDLSLSGMEKGEGGPFGAVVVKAGVIIGRGNNRTFIDNDPTAHAEVVAIRDATKNLGMPELPGCEIYSSAEPCPMCMSAIYWARISKLYFGNTKHDSAVAGFDDSFVYKELSLPWDARTLPTIQLQHEDALKAFEVWKKMNLA